MKKLIILFLFCIILPVITAQSQHLGTFPKNNCVNLIQTCDNCTYINITKIVLPNSTILNNDLIMTRSGTDYNYTFCQTNISGNYFYTTCGDEDTITTCVSVSFTINPTGIESTGQRTESLSRTIYVIFAIFIVLFVAFIYSYSSKKSKPITWTFFIVSIIFLVIGFNMISITLSDEVINPRLETFFDSFVAIAWIFYWFAAGLLIIMWVFTFLNTWLYKKNMERFNKFGGNY